MLLLKKKILLKFKRGNLPKKLNKKVSKKASNVHQADDDDDFQTEKVISEVVPTKKRKSVSDDASVSKKSRTKAPEYYFRVDVKKRFVGKPQLYNPYSVIKDLNEKLLDVQKELFRKFPFGHFIDVSNFNYQIQSIHLVLLRQIHTERDDVEKSYDPDLFKSKKLLGFKEIFSMHGTTEKVIVRDVASIFFSGVLKDDEDMVKITLVYFFFGYLYSYSQGKKINNFIFAMVDGDDYIKVLNRFGWGKLLWEKTLYHFKIALKDGNGIFEQLAKKRKIEKGHKLKEYPIAFLIWLYEIIPSLSP
uniref:Uncharacterized protein n=1 Tax=Cannabis sativa TaxID=3483 RepID=A0A803PIH8_CANSA